VFTALIIVVTGQIMFDTTYWTIFNHLSIWGSLLLYLLMVVYYYESRRFVYAEIEKVFKVMV
jgi:hypothetical protein